MLCGETSHAANYSAAVLDTVNVYVQESSETEPPVAELEAFIQASPFMVQEMARQSALLARLTEIRVLNANSLVQLKALNNQAILVDFSVLSYA